MNPETVTVRENYSVSVDSKRPKLVQNTGNIHFYAA